MTTIQRTSVQIDTKDVKKAKLYAVKNDITLAQFMRNAINFYLKKHKKHTNENVVFETEKTGA